VGAGWVSGTRLAHIHEVSPDRERIRKPLQGPLPTGRVQRPCSLQFVWRIAAGHWRVQYFE
jgi:hypothetical protein